MRKSAGKSWDLMDNLNCLKGWTDISDNWEELTTYPSTSSPVVEERFAWGKELFFYSLEGNIWKSSCFSCYLSSAGEFGSEAKPSSLHGLLHMALMYNKTQWKEGSTIIETQEVIQMDWLNLIWITSEHQPDSATLFKTQHFLGSGKTLVMLWGMENAQKEGIFHGGTSEMQRFRTCWSAAQADHPAQQRQFHFLRYKWLEKAVPGRARIHKHTARGLEEKISSTSGWTEKTWEWFQWEQYCQWRLSALQTELVPQTRFPGVKSVMINTKDFLIVTSEERKTQNLKRVEIK